MSSTRGVGKRALRGIRWTLLATAVSNAMKLAVIVLLGRLLDPDEFGTVAAAMTVVQFARMVRDLGVGLALVQREEIEPQHVETGFAFSLASGAVLTGAIFASAPLVADFYGIADVEPIVRELSFLFLLMSISAVSNSLCQRDLEFGKLAAVDLTCYAVGSGVAVGLALAGAGAHALSFGYLAEAGLTAIILFALRPAPFPRWRGSRLRELLRFGSGMTIARVGVYFAEQGDKMIIGRQLDAAALGFYTRAYDIVTYPSAVYHSVVGTVLFPSFSRIQGDPERLGRALRRALFANAVLLFPASAGLIVLGDELILLLMGPGWESAVLPFQVIALGLYFRVSYKLGQIIVMASGESYRLAAWQFVYAAMIVAGAMIGIRWGITGVAAATAIAMTIHFFNLTRIARTKTHLAWGALAGAHVQGLLVAATAVLGVWPVAHLLRGEGAPAPVVVIAAAVAGAFGFVVLLLRGLRDPDSDWTWLLGMIRGAFRGKRRDQARGA